MSDYTWISIDQPKDFDQLEALLDIEFDPASVSAKLKQEISLRVAGVLIERDYIDKDYRSTFYAYYAKMGRAYREDCARLHFFEAGVGYDEATSRLISLTSTLDVNLAGKYFGFIVLRPTHHATIGRSILSPDIRKGARGNAIQGEHEVHLLGNKLKVWGFPSMAQHGDISICGHVCCWSILRHYSECFAQHREWLLQDVSKLASTFDPGGLLPGLGITTLSAKNILHAAGTYPLLIRKGDDRELFYVQFLAYLESGFPLFVTMADEQHAIVANGYAWKEPPNEPPFIGTHAWEQVESILVVDDNALPYTCVNRDPVTGSLPTVGAPSYDANSFDAFIVALPEKIFYSAIAVEEFSRITLHDFLKAIMTMPSKTAVLRRYFITTISGLRRYARENASALGPKLVNMLMRLKTSQFVWVVEYSSLDQWSKGHISARAILDATASLHDTAPTWFAHGEDIAVLFNREKPGLDYRAIALDRPKHTPLGRMEHNLRPVRVWKDRAVNSAAETQ